MKLIRRIHSLIIKELQSVLGEPSGRVLLVMPVILQTVLFPFAATLDVNDAALTILNRDAGAASNELVQRFTHISAFTDVHLVHSQREMELAIEKRQSMLAVSIPQDFSRLLAQGEAAPVQVLLDGRRSNGAQIAFGYLQATVERYLKDRAAASGRTLPSETIVRYWFNPNLNYKYYTLSNLVAIITTIGALILTALSVAREREQGTFDQVVVSPLTPEMVMIGKAVPASLVAFGQATVILLTAVFLYQVPFRGSLLMLYGGMLFYALSLVGVGLLISSVCSTQQQAFLGAFSFMMPAILLSGFTSPVENMPHWLQILTLANPIRHFVEIVKGVFLKDISFGHFLSLVVPLILIGLCTLSAASFMFRRRIG